MGNRFSSGKKAIAVCDRCGFQYLLSELREEVRKLKKTNLLVCHECFDPDHPQLQLGMYPVEDPQALLNPRRDNTQGFQDNVVPIGSRDIQWGWAPVGGASSIDAAQTPNYLTTYSAVGTVTVLLT